MRLILKRVTVLPNFNNTILGECSSQEMVGWKLGNIFQDMGSHDQAILYYDKALALDNNNPKALNNRGFSKNLQEKFEEAISDYRLALETDRSYVCTWFNLSAVLYRQRRIVEALQAVQVAFAIDPTDERYRTDYDFFLRMLKKSSDVFADQTAPTS